MSSIEKGALRIGRRFLNVNQAQREGFWELTQLAHRKEVLVSKDKQRFQSACRLSEFSPRRVKFRFFGDSLSLLDRSSQGREQDLQLLGIGRSAVPYSASTDKMLTEMIESLKQQREI